MALLAPVIVQSDNFRGASLDKTMNEIRVWLDGEHIEPVHLKMVVCRAGLGFEINFRRAHEAERFQKRFAALMTRAGQRS